MAQKDLIKATDFFNKQISELISKKRGDHVWLNGIQKMLQSKINFNVIQNDLIVFKKYFPSGNVLDFGSGSGYNSLLLGAEGYEVKSVDLNSYNMYEKSEYNRIMTEDQIDLWKSLNAEYKNIDFTHYENKLPYKEGEFGSVFAYAVLEHVPDNLIESVLGEVSRVLKPGGILFISRLPRQLSFTEFLARKLHLDSHEKLYWDTEASEVLNKAGFEILDQSFVEIVPAYPENITNRFFPFFKAADTILSYTPVKYLSHHLRIVSKKNQ